MPPSELPGVEAFWRWSEELYTHAPSAWLEVQAAGGNVNLALLLAWFDEAGLPAPTLVALEQALVPLEAILHEFRTLRRRLKPKLDQTEYQALLTHELILEREQQARLLAACAISQASANSTLVVGTALGHYLTKLGTAADYAALLGPTINT